MLDTMTVRKMPFEFPDEIEPDFMDGDHERSFSLSLVRFCCHIWNPI